MNTYTKYCPNVWVAQCTETHKKGCITAAVCWFVIIVIVILMEVL